MTNRAMIKGWSDQENLGREGEGQQSAKGTLGRLWRFLAQETELCKDSQGLHCGSDNSVSVQQHHCPSKQMQLRQYQEMNPYVAHRKMTKLSAKAMVQDSENGCPGTHPSTKHMQQRAENFCLLLPPVSKSLFLYEKVN